MRAHTAFLAGIVLVLAGLPARSQDTQAPSSGGWINDTRTGCKAWRANPGPQHAVMWTGACKNGLIDGEGILLWFYKDGPNGKYQGSVREGRYEGRGVLSYKEGGSYSGDWQNGLRNGSGHAEWRDGARYDGGWKDDKASGSGTLVDARGNNFAGTWLGGCLRQADPKGIRLRVGVGTDQCNGR